MRTRHLSPTRSTQSTQFDTLADAYEATFDALPFRRHVEAHSIWRAIGPVTGKRLLDLGCGSGVYTREAARRGAHPVFGVDASPGMLDYARRRGLDVRYLEHDITQTRHTGEPDIDRRCDLVLAVYLLPYATTAAALTAMCRFARNCLAPGGRLVAAVMNPDFSRAPGFYRPYGFDLTAGQRLRDGDPVHLHAEVGRHTFKLTAYYWTHASHEQALHAAGFHGITWQPPTCSPDAVDPDQFDAYLAHPHTMILSATAD